MSTIFAILSVFLGVFSGISYSFENFFGNGTNVFVIISIAFYIVLAVFRFEKYSSFHYFEQKKWSFLGILSSFVLFLLGIYSIIFISERAINNIYYILSGFMIISSFCFLITTISLAKGKLNKFVSSATAFPTFWLLAEYIMIFKNCSNEPNLLKFSITLLSIMFTNIAIYKFSAIFCSERKNKFAKTYLYSLYMMIAFITILVIGVVSQNSIVDMNFENVRILISVICSNLFLTQYFLKK